MHLHLFQFFHPLVILLPNPQYIDTAPRIAIQERLVGIDISLESGVNSPLHDPERGAKTWRYSVADGMVEVIAEDERRAGD